IETANRPVREGMRFSGGPVLYINTGSRRAEGEVAQNAGNLMLEKEYEVVRIAVCSGCTASG
ncbi:hypothetical protein, partial [uncultured Megasphaera sp.]|uniref:hypothetical protein n=1 Tax=uncultured Megasphaera sp. TaxID=165188 RepID=UPI00265D60AE